MRLGLFLASLLLAAPAAAQAPQPIVIGESYTLDTPAFGDQRTINVSLPSGYADQPERRYPVLYLIDGGVDQDLVHIVGTQRLGEIWGRSGEAIVVGVASKDRRAELVGPTADPELLKRYPTAGQSAKFRAFLRATVKPFIETRFRTDGTSGVIGESLAGLFVAETWLREPDLFTRYAAISPSLWWDQARLSKEAASLIGAGQQAHPLFVATADEGADLEVNVDRFVAALGKAPRWCWQPHPELGHATIYHAVSPAALQFLFPPAEAPDPQFGFDIRCGKGLIGASAE